MVADVTPHLKTMMTGGLLVSNAKARDELGWVSRFPTHREGVAAMATHHQSGVPA